MSRPHGPPPTVPIQQRKRDLKTELWKLRRRLREHPQDVAALCQLGDLQAELNAYRPSAFRRRQARQAYQKAMTLAPKDPTPVNNLGVLLCDQGDYPGALERFLRALELDPEDATIHENRCIAEFHLGKRAALDIPEGLARKPGTQSAYFDPHGL